MAFAHHYLRFRPKSTAPTGGYYSDQVATAYGFPKGINTTGLTIGIIELGGQFYPADLQSFCQARGIPVPLVDVVPVNGATITPDPNGADVEVMLDSEVVAGAFQGAHQRIYFCDNSEAGFIAGVQQAVGECDVVSISWGAPEDQWSSTGIQQLNTIMAAKPVTVASGDSGSSDGESGKHTDFPSSGTNALACGGTTLPAGSNGLPNLAAETSWPDSGGGISTVFAKPGYQATETASGSMRGSPDIAGCADPNTPYNVYVGGQWIQVGGTSAVAPLMAALLGLLKIQAGKLPDVHSLVYASGACRDIIGGSNGAYQAGPGYDLVTGNGVAIASKLLTEILGTGSPPPAPPPVPPPSPPPPVPPPSPPPPMPSPPPSPPPSPVPQPLPVAVIMQIIDQMFAAAEQAVKNNPLEEVVLQEIQKWVDSNLPTLLGSLEKALWQVILSTIESRVSKDPCMSLVKNSIMSKLWKGLGSQRALPPGTLINILQTLIQDAPEILSVIQAIVQAFQGGKAAA